MPTNAHEVPSYIVRVSVPLRHVFPLSETLDAVAPIDIDAVERAALEHLKTIARETRDARSARDRVPAQLRELWNAHAVAWSAVQRGLIAAASIPAHVSNAGAKARALLDTLLPEGVTFVTGDAPAAWAEGARRIHRLDAESLREPLVNAIGADLVAAAERATNELGVVIKTPQLAKQTLKNKREQFSRAVSRYARVLAAKLDEDEPASVERFRNASAPIEEFRVTRGKREEIEDELEPAPPAPPEPAQPQAPTG